MPRICTVGPVTISQGQPLCIIAGPCLLESLDMGLHIGRTLRDACAKASLSYIFKASFDKANRSSIASHRGPGLDQGLDWLTQIGEELDAPITTDIHDPSQAMPVAQAVDLLQIPAFLCRQTDLLAAAAQAAQRHNRAVNIKKGQFLSPQEMAGPVRKLHESGCDNLLMTERGTFFGYHRLVNDFIGLGDLMDLDLSAFDGGDPPPICFDVTHSTQLPGSGEQTGGRPDRAPLLAKAAAAAGVQALFLECHPDPAQAMSDAGTVLRLDSMPDLLGTIASIHAAANSTTT